MHSHNTEALQTKDAVHRLLHKIFPAGCITKPVGQTTPTGCNSLLTCMRVAVEESQLKTLILLSYDWSRNF